MNATDKELKAILGPAYDAFVAAGLDRDAATALVFRFGWDAALNGTIPASDQLEGGKE